jgi:hypothetical protein
MVGLFVAAVNPPHKILKNTLGTGTFLRPSPEAYIPPLDATGETF